MPEIVYLLFHNYLYEDGSEELKLIGCYSSRDRAEASKNRLKQMPYESRGVVGFRGADRSTTR